MAFWLARERRGQQSDWIQRFDPRFWTVDFPRPMMASVVTTGPDSLRVDCEFHHKGEIAGLIWESEDRLDHPLLAYETQRDYAHLSLSFRWRSEGLRALDATDGPTLTIEGRDAQGQAKSWYVRLWNYAAGSPNDAQITLPFSQLEAGWSLPGEAVHVRHIDRIFVSLVSEEFEEASTEVFATAQYGWAEMSDIVVDGERAMLEIGDVLLPPHGERICTAYDDSYNQTPARLLRSVEQLGYREEITHYIGMSHYYRLTRIFGQPYVDRIGDFCEPARRWHQNYLSLCRDMGFRPILSVSYELFNATCPSWWPQRNHIQQPALTGWVPPSVVVSPAHPEVNQFLQSIALKMVAMMEEAGLDVRIQIGEPWWWVDPATGAPFIYDHKAKQAYGAGLATITDLRAPLTDAQRHQLDLAGAVLAQSTLALAQTVRAAASSDAEVLLLLFTPTIFDPAMPDWQRAVVPQAWAYPAFDRLQIEDYDWLTSGARSLRRWAYSAIDERLGYPIGLQDYLSGFVLDEGDAESLWPLIDAGLDEARARGIERRFVWALPQVQRDGYTRLPITENDVQAFDDIAYPLALGRDASVAPEFSTSVAVTSSGHESRNALWSDARLRYDVGPGIRSETELGELLAFFRARYGPARGFRLRDPFDNSSNAMTGEPGPVDQSIGTGNGTDDRFRLVKSYGEQVRPITRPEEASIRISIDGDETMDWSLEAGGWIVFPTPPADGADIRAGFRFDVPVRFAEDRLDVSGLSFATGEAPSVPLIEIREAS